MSNVVGPGDDMTLHDLNKMLYLYQVLKDTLEEASKNTFTQFSYGI